MTVDVIVGKIEVEREQKFPFGIVTNRTNESKKSANVG